DTTIPKETSARQLIPDELHKDLQDKVIDKALSGDTSGQKLKLKSTIESMINQFWTDEKLFVGEKEENIIRGRINTLLTREEPKVAKQENGPVVKSVAQGA